MRFGSSPGTPALRIGVVWTIAIGVAVGCGGASHRGDGGDAGVTAACTRTADCQGGEFCDRGACATVATGDDFGHGYGAQCVSEDFYPTDPRLNRRVHCREFECVAGHCSSCVSDEECDPGYVCSPAPQHPAFPELPPAYPGRRCTLRTVVENPAPPCETSGNPVPCVPTRPEEPEPTLSPNEANECSGAAGCLGDEFCDRGRCAPVLVDALGHGYGAQFIRREAPSLGDTCLGFLSIGRFCSSCLSDSECYPEAPYCAFVPNRPEGRSCSPHPESEYYDVSGQVAPHFPDAEESERWLVEYRDFLDYHARYRRARLAAGLPVPPIPPAIAEQDGGVGP